MIPDTVFGSLMTGGVIDDGKLDWALQQRDNPLIFSKCLGDTAENAAYGGLALAGFGATCTLYLGAFEFAVGAGYYNVAASVAARHAAWEPFQYGAKDIDRRFFSDILTRSLVNNGPRLKPDSIKISSQQSVTEEKVWAMWRITGLLGPLLTTTPNTRRYEIARSRTSTQFFIKRDWSI